MNVSIVLKLVDGVTGPIRRVQQAIADATKAMEKTKERADKAFKSAANIKHAADGVANFAAKATAGIMDVVNAASNFEQAMLGVAKQVDGARDLAGKLTPVYFDMAKQIQMLGREVPMATTEIAKMVAAGARMGIAKNELLEFTKTAAMMAEAFELPAAELAEQMGKIKGLFGMKTQKEVTALADAVNYLDDNAISKGGDIIDFLQRTGGVAGSIKVTAKDMAALGSTLLTLGERTETASTAVNAMVQKFASAEVGTKKFKSAMQEIGLSTRDVQKGMQLNAQDTILKVMEAVNKLPKDKRIGVMVELVGLEHSDTLAKLAGNIGEYRKQIALASSEKAEGSMSREFQARLATTSAQFEIMKNKVSELAVNIGSVLLPEINKLLDAVGPIATKTAEWMKEHSTLTKTLGGSIFVISAVAFALGGIMNVVSMLTGAKGVVLLARVFAAQLMPAIIGVLPFLGGLAGGLWAVVAPTLIAAAPFVAMAAAVGALGLALLQVIRLAREWDELDFGQVLKGFDAAVNDGSVWDTLTLNPLSGLGGKGGGLVASAPSLGPAVPAGTPNSSIASTEAPRGAIEVHITSENKPIVKSVKASGGIELEATAGMMMSGG